MERHTFLGRPLSPAFSLRALTLAPGSTRPYDEDEWRGALVVVESGVVHIECTRGGCRRFDTGATMWLEGMPLRYLHNRGSEPVRLAAITRTAAGPCGPAASSPAS